MTDEDQTDTAAAESDAEEETDATDEAVISATMRRTLYRGTFIALAVFGSFAAVMFYMNTTQAISVWVTPDYRPLFQAAFNLTVVIACGLGLTILIERFR